MCESCGCNREEPYHVHTGASGIDSGTGGSRDYHVHRNARGEAHVHAHSHSHGDGRGEARTVDVNRSVLAANDRLAEQNRGFFRAKNVRVLNLVSSPGAGKTALLKRTLQDLGERVRMATIVGDLATENDAQRLRERGGEVVQVTTGTLCHLDASMVMSAAGALDLDAIDLLFIENVGNLVCPASFDLGEGGRVVLLSVVEGEDKPLKYPPVFKGADLVLVTKIDLAGAAGCDRARILENLRRVAPGAEILEVSSRTGEGMEAWYGFLGGEPAAAAPGRGAAP